MRTNIGCLISSPGHQSINRAALEPGRMQTSYVPQTHPGGINQQAQRPWYVDFPGPTDR
jgi:hypothetical protein